MQISTAVVLAAGEGTRLRPMTRNRPKTMLPAAGRPILEHVLEVLVDAGIERLCLVVGYGRQRVQEHFGHEFRNRPITYVHQNKQLGSAHALQQAEAAVEGPFLACNGDRVIDPDIITDTLSAFDGEPTVAVLEHGSPSEYGAVRVDGDRLVELVERPDSSEFRLINAGIYAFDESVFDATERTPRRDGELQLPDVIGTLMADGPVYVARTGGLWADATYPWDLLFLGRELLARGRVTQPERGPGVWIANSATVHADAVCQPPVVVGPDAVVAAGAVVGPNVSIGRNATIGSNATVEDALVDADTRVGAGSTLLESVTGESVEIGAGVVSPGGPGDVRVGDRVFEDQTLGVVLADRTTVGGGVSFDPGTLVGADATIESGAHVSGTVPDGAEVIR